MAMAAVTILALASFAAFGFWRGRRPRAPVPANRDFASVSLNRGPAATALALDDAAIEAGPHLGAAQSPGTANGETMGEFPMPKTYEEALAILGASPDAEVAAIKKIVDGLRKTWHPDLTRPEADRAYRERRLQQINVAWDVVSRRRTAA
jgi:hypothetical protein